jgi:hypothetical protein
MYYVATKTIPYTDAAILEYHADVRHLEREFDTTIRSKITAIFPTQRNKKKFNCIIISTCIAERAPFGFTLVRNEQLYTKIVNNA